MLRSLLPRHVLLLRGTHNEADFGNMRKKKKKEHLQAFRMSVAGEEEKRHKDSRQQDPRKGGREEGAIRRSAKGSGVKSLAPLP